MKVNFRLHKKNKKDKTGFLRMGFSYTGKRFRYFVGISMPDNHWSNTKQRVKASVSNSLEINKRLSEIAEVTVKIYYELLNNNITPSNSMLKEKLDESLRGVSSQLSFYEFVNEFIKRSSNTKKPSTIKEYIYTVNDLKTFEKHIKRRIEWDTIDMKFYDAYMDYQYNVKGNSQNLFGKRIKTLKTFLNDALERGANKHLMYKGFKVLQRETDAIYLTEDEIEKMYKLDLTENKRLEKVRDLFIVECNTGVRFEDLMHIEKENVLKDSIKIKVRKTGEVLNTLLLPDTQAILKKYNYQLPRISNTNYNLYLKEIGELAGINDTIIHNTYKAGKQISIKKKKFELISSHTSRRSFATNMYHRGHSSVIIMSITGHKKESTFLKYIRITNEEAVKIISLNYKKKAS
jgi:integrase